MVHHMLCIPIIPCRAELLSFAVFLWGSRSPLDRVFFRGEAQALTLCSAMDDDVPCLHRHHVAASLCQANWFLLLKLSGTAAQETLVGSDVEVSAKALSSSVSESAEEEEQQEEDPMMPSDTEAFEGAMDLDLQAQNQLWVFELEMRLRTPGCTQMEASALKAASCPLFQRLQEQGLDPGSQVAKVWLT